MELNTIQLFTEIELIIWFLQYKHNNRMDIKYTTNNVISHINDTVNEHNLH